MNIKIDILAKIKNYNALLAVTCALIPLLKTNKQDSLNILETILSEFLIENDTLTKDKLLDIANQIYLSLQEDLDNQ